MMRRRPNSFSSCLPSSQQPSSYSSCSYSLLSLLTSALRSCSLHDDKPGGPHQARTPFRPRVRPAKIVMPVDTDDLYHPRRSGAVEEYLEGANAVQEQATDHGAVKLGVVPENLTFSDLFGAAVQNVESSDDDFAKRRTTTTTAAGKKQRRRQQQSSLSSENDVGIVTKDRLFADFQLVGSSSDNAATADENAIVSTTTYKVWDILESTPIVSPNLGNLGPLAAAGQSLVELEVASHISKLYPRLRSSHVQTLSHSVCGIQPMLRVARQLGIVEMCGLDTDARLWNELCNLTQREETLRRQYVIHKQRLEQGLPSRFTWFYQRQLKGVRHALRHFPSDGATLLPRVEWIRSLTFAFIGWLEHTSVVDPVEFIQEHFCREFDIDAPSSSLGSEEVDVEEEDPRQHPLNIRQDRRAHRFTTTSHVHGAEPFDDPYARRVADELKHLATRRVVEAVHPDNALKEAQIILNYSLAKEVDPATGKKKFDFSMMVLNDNNGGGGPNNSDSDDATVKFDVEIVRTNVPLMDSDSMHGLGVDPERQSTHSAKTLEAEFVVWMKKRRGDNSNNNNKRQLQSQHMKRSAGEEEGEMYERTVVGRGIGLTEQDAIQASALDFVRRYYFSPKARERG